MRVSLHPLSLMALLLSLTGCQFSAQTSNSSLPPPRNKSHCLHAEVLTHTRSFLRCTRVKLSLLSERQRIDSKSRFRCCHALKMEDLDQGTARKARLSRSHWKMYIDHKDTGVQVVSMDFRKSPTQHLPVVLRDILAVSRPSLKRGLSQKEMAGIVCRTEPPQKKVA